MGKLINATTLILRSDATESANGTDKEQAMKKQLVVLVAVLLATGSGAFAAESSEVTQLQKSCDGGGMEGCFNLGMYYSNGIGVKQDHFKAKEFYQKACDGGVMDSCFALGISYDYGFGVKKDNFKAKELYQKACDGGVMASCFSLGNSYRDGKGVKQNHSKAKALFGKACDGGYQIGCDEYKELNEQGY